MSTMTGNLYGLAAQAMAMTVAATAIKISQDKLLRRLAVHQNKLADLPIDTDLTKEIEGAYLALRQHSTNPVLSAAAQYMEDKVASFWLPVISTFREIIQQYSPVAYNQWSDGLITHQELLNRTVCDLSEKS